MFATQSGSPTSTSDSDFDDDSAIDYEMEGTVVVAWVLNNKF